jgi:hypothetical protein
MTYTATGNADLEAKVARVVEGIVTRIATELKPASLFLTGSFGRGEATVRERDGRPEFLSDLEVVAVSRRYPWQQLTGQSDRLARELHRTTAIEVGISGLALSLAAACPFLFRALRPTMMNYDLKYGSQLFHGTDIRTRLPAWTPEDVPLWEGLRLLFNRMSAALWMLYRGGFTAGEKTFGIYKVVLACQDVLLLGHGRYDSSYAARLALTKQLLEESSGEPYDTLKPFLPLFEAATRFKLTGNGALPDLEDLWAGTARLADIVLRDAVQRDLGILYSDYLDFQSRYAGGRGLNRHTQARFGCPAYQNGLTLGKMMLAPYRKVPWGYLTRQGRPWSRIVYSVIPLVFFGRQPDGTVHRPYLERAGRVLAGFGGLASSLAPDSPEAVAAELYRLIYFSC